MTSSSTPNTRAPRRRKGIGAAAKMGLVLFTAFVVLGVVCEDDPIHRELIRASLARGPYTIYEIEDGRHLVEAA